MTTRQSKLIRRRPPTGLQMMMDLVQTHKITPLAATTWETGDARQIFTEGKAIFTTNWNFVWAQAQAHGVENHRQCRRVAGAEDEGAKSAATLGGWGWAINSASKNVTAAVAAIKTLTAPEQMKMLFLEGGVVPTRHVAVQGPGLRQDSTRMRRSCWTSSTAPWRDRAIRVTAKSRKSSRTSRCRRINQQKTAKAAVADIAKTIQPMLV